MSTRAIDEKVVEMRFDNKDFERNVATSMSTLDKLKSALDLSGAVNGLSAVSAAANNFSMGGLGTAVETVQAKFSALEVIAVTALANITNSAVNAGKNLVKSLSVDQITAGFSKYEEKTKAVQTIMSATNKTEEEVLKSLEKLNWFTDETSYSFTDMVNNIGKFTSAGVDLDVAVTAMEGIANEAALSGQGINEASRAMYNFAQALGTGSVKLMDWKSIENANMATKEFKQTIIDTAIEMGTLERAGDEVVTVGKNTAVTVENFNTALAEGWFSKDVLVSVLQKYGAYADKIYELSDDYDTASDAMKAFDAEADLAGDTVLALGSKAFKAAQVAKTFTDAIDATKDAVSTGWMQSFEIIFGSYEESSKLWTDLANTLWDVFASGAEARNELLTEWKELGGRDSAIAVVSNLFEGLSSILGHVKEAFSTIFPPMTSQRLFDLTKGVENVTEAFMKFWAPLEGEENEAFNRLGAPIGRLTRTFEGLFSVVDIVKTVLSSLFKSFSSGASSVFTLQNLVLGFLGYTAQIGDRLTAIGRAVHEFFDEWDSYSDDVASVISPFGRLQRTFAGVAAVVSIIRNAFRSLITAIQELELPHIDFRPFGFSLLDITAKIGDFLVSLNNTVEETDFFYEKFSAFFARMRQIPQQVADIYRRITGVPLSETLSNIGDSVQNAINKILDALRSLHNDGEQDASEGVKGILKAFRPLELLSEGLKKIFGGIVNIFKKVSPVFMNFAHGVGDAFGLLSEAIGAIIENADFEKFYSVMGIGMAILEGSWLANLIKMTKGLGDTVDDISEVPSKITKTFGEIGESISDFLHGKREKNLPKELLTMAIALGILAASLTMLASVDGESAAMAVASVSVALVTLVASLSKLSGGQAAKGIGGLIPLSISLLIVASAIKKLSELDFAGVAKGLAGLEGAMLIMVSAAKKLSGVRVSGMTNLILLSTSLLIVASAVKKLGELDPDVLFGGLIGMAGALTALSLAMNAMPKNITGTGAGLVLVAASLNILAGVIEKIGNLDADVLFGGLIGITGALSALALTLNLMPKNTVGIGAGLLIVGAALNIVTSAMKTMGEMDEDVFFQGLVGMAGALSLLAAALNLMSGTLSGAAALLVASTSLIVLAGALRIIGGMDMGEMLMSLGMLAATLTILGAAAYIIGPMAPALLALAGAIALLGVACAAVGAGMVLFGTGLAALAAGGTGAIGMLILAIESIIGLIPAIILEVGKGILGVIKLIGDAAGTIAYTVYQIGSAVLDTAKLLIPKFVDTVLTLIDEVLTAIDEHGTSIVEHVLSILEKVLRGLRDHIPEITNLLGDIAAELVYELPKQFGKILAALEKLFEEMWDKILDFFGVHSPSTKFAELAGNCIAGFVKGIGDNAVKLFTSIGTMMTNAVTKVGEKAGSFFAKGGEIIKFLVEGITGNKDKVDTAAIDAITSSANAATRAASSYHSAGQTATLRIESGIESMQWSLNDTAESTMYSAKASANSVSFYSVGLDAVRGMARGMLENIDQIRYASTSIGAHALGGISTILDENSPSKEMAKLGRYATEGFIIGLVELADKVGSEAGSVGEMALDGITEATRQISNLAEFNDDIMTPVIRPVVDLSDVYYGANELSSMFSSRYFGVNAAVDINTDLARGLDGINVNNSSVVSAIEKMRGDIAKLSDSITEMQLVMDTGALVGSITKPIDRTLGQRVVYAGRGI